MQVLESIQREVWFMMVTMMIFQKIVIIFIIVIVNVIAVV